MAQDSFWKGVTVGLVGGAVLTRLLSSGMRKGSRPAAANPWRGLPEYPRQRRIALRRDEGAGDPSMLTAARTGANAGFERQGGAPGSTHRPESSEVPGRPGQAIDYTDASAPVRLSSRTLTLRRSESFLEDTSPD